MTAGGNPLTHVKAGAPAVAGGGWAVARAAETLIAPTGGRAWMSLYGS